MDAGEGMCSYMRRMRRDNSLENMSTIYIVPKVMVHACMHVCTCMCTGATLSGTHPNHNIYLIIVMEVIIEAYLRLWGLQLSTSTLYIK